MHFLLVLQVCARIRLPSNVPRLPLRFPIAFPNGTEPRKHTATKAAWRSDVAHVILPRGVRQTGYNSVAICNTQPRGRSQAARFLATCQFFVSQWHTLLHPGRAKPHGAATLQT